MGLRPTNIPHAGIRPRSLFENYAGRCFRAKGWLARRDEGEYPWWIFD
ncbi:MAG: hypothetical protein JWR26_927 [Pedosphaera sp.]|nr:hypothetical protein [Pedosphaera sp.]